MPDSRSAISPRGGRQRGSRCAQRSTCQRWQHCSSNRCARCPRPDGLRRGNAPPVRQLRKRPGLVQRAGIARWRGIPPDPQARREVRENSFREQTGVGIARPSRLRGDREAPRDHPPRREHAGQRFPAPPGVAAPQPPPCVSPSAATRAARPWRWPEQSHRRSRSAVPASSARPPSWMIWMAKIRTGCRQFRRGLALQSSIERAAALRIAHVEMQAVCPGHACLPDCLCGLRDRQGKNRMIRPAPPRTVRSQHDRWKRRHSAAVSALPSLSTISPMWLRSRMNGGASSTWSPATPSIVPPMG